MADPFLDGIFGISDEGAPKGAPVFEPKSLLLSEKVKSWMPTVEKHIINYPNVDTDFVLGVMQQESGGQEDVISSAGAYGPMQLMRQTARGLGVDRKNPDENIGGGIKLLSQLLKKYDGDKRKALAAYNWGERGLDKAIANYGIAWDQHLPEETTDYIQRIGSNIDIGGYKNVGDFVDEVFGLNEPTPTMRRDEEAIAAGFPQFNPTQPKIEKKNDAIAELFDIPEEKPVLTGTGLIDKIEAASGFTPEEPSSTSVDLEVKKPIASEITEITPESLKFHTATSDVRGGTGLDPESLMPPEMLAKKQQRWAEGIGQVEAWLTSTENALTYGSTLNDEEKAALQEAKPVASITGDLTGMLIPIGGGTAIASRTLRAFGPVAKFLLKRPKAGKALIDATSRGSAFAADYTMRNSEDLTSNDPEVRNRALGVLATGVAASAVSVAPEILKAGWYQPFLQGLFGGATELAAQKILGEDIGSPEMLTQSILQTAMGGIFGISMVRAPKVRARIEPAAEKAGEPAKITDEDIALNMALKSRIEKQLKETNDYQKLSEAEKNLAEIEKFEKTPGNDYIWIEEGIPAQEAKYVKRGSVEESEYRSELAAYRDIQEASRKAGGDQSPFGVSKTVPRGDERTAVQKESAVETGTDGANGPGVKYPEFLKTKQQRDDYDFLAKLPDEKYDLLDNPTADLSVIDFTGAPEGLRQRIDARREKNARAIESYNPENELRQELGKYGSDPLGEMNKELGRWDGLSDAEKIVKAEKLIENTPDEVLRTIGVEQDAGTGLFNENSLVNAINDYRSKIYSERSVENAARRKKAEEKRQSETPNLFKQPKLSEETGTLEGLADTRRPWEIEQAKREKERQDKRREQPLEGTMFDKNEMEARATEQGDLFADKPQLDRGFGYDIKTGKFGIDRETLDLQLDGIENKINKGTFNILSLQSTELNKFPTNSFNEIKASFQSDPKKTLQELRKIIAGEKPPENVIQFPTPEGKIAGMEKEPSPLVMGGVKYDPTGSGNLPKYAGNVNVERIGSDYDAKRAIHDLSNEYRKSIDANKGPKATHEETKALAEQIGLSSGELLKRKRGEVWDRARTLAARDLHIKAVERLVKLKNDLLKKRSLGEATDKDMVDFILEEKRVAAIQAEISGLASEAGRLLESFKILSQAKRSKETFEQIRDKIERGKSAEAILEGLSKIDDNDIGTMSKFLTRANKTGFASRINRYFIESILSALPTDEANILGNSVFGGMRTFLETPFSALAERVIAPLQGRKIELRLLETKHEASGLINAIIPAWKAFTRTLLTGEQKYFAKPTEDIKSLSRSKWAALLPTRRLSAEDEFFKTLAFGAKIKAVAYRTAKREGLVGKAMNKRIDDIIRNPELYPEEYSAAWNEAKYRTFTDSQGEITKAINKLRRAIPGKLAYYIVPFLNTPTKILMAAMDRLPVTGEISLAVKASRGLKGKEVSEQIGKMIPAHLLAIPIVLMTRSGLITGSGPSKKEEKNVWNKTHQAYSVKIGDSYYSYARLEPMSSVVGMIADFSTLDITEQNQDMAKELAERIAYSIQQNVYNKSYFSQLEATINAAQEPGKYGEKFIANFAGAAIPNIVSKAGESFDPYYRQRSDVKDIIKSRIPGMSQTLFPKRDIWGKPIERDKKGIAASLSPIGTRKISTEPVDIELDRLGVKVRDPSKNVSDVKLNDEQFDFYQQKAGERAFSQVSAYIGSDAYRGVDDDRKKDIILNLINVAREYARNETKQKYNLLDVNDAIAASDKEPNKLFNDLKKSGIELNRSVFWKKYKAIKRDGITTEKKTMVF